ncbi:MAG TPA: glycosyl hydrolase family 28 protein, partial [Candidatus Pelethenecus sp.]|nr:glycosyl hydrolase family 28 protein [Candidatus Pelethenecus sp.]
PCRNIWVHDCKVFDAHGGFVVGSEMSRGVENILVENCTFIGTDIGIRFKSAMGRGGVVKNITLKNIYMANIIEEACIFTMGYVLSNLETDKTDQMESVDPEDIPEFKDITLENIICDGAKIGIKILGLKELPIHDISFKDVQIRAQESMSLTFAEQISFQHVTISTPNQTEEYNEQIF